MNKRGRVVNALERLLLSALMGSIAFVMEKALDRMVAKRPNDPTARSRLGARLIRRFVPAMQVNHHHDRQPPQQA